jgi:hypothetical protein
MFQEEFGTDNPELGEILKNMVENTIMFLTNDLPSLLEQDRVAEIRRFHKDEILKNVPETERQINALISKARDRLDVNTWTYLNQIKDSCRKCTCDVCIEVTKQQDRLKELEGKL